MGFASISRLITTCLLLLPWLASCYPNPLPLDDGLQQIVARPRISTSKSTVTIHTTITYTLLRVSATTEPLASSTRGPPLALGPKETSRAEPTGHKTTASQEDRVREDSAGIVSTPKLSAGSKTSLSPFRGRLSGLGDIFTHLLQLGWALGSRAHAHADAENGGIEMSLVTSKEHAAMHKTCSLGPGRTVSCSDQYFEDVFEFGTDPSDLDDDNRQPTHDL